MSEIEEKIKYIIECIYQCEFKGRVKVNEDKDSYILRLSLNQDERPIFITYQGDQEDFVNYVIDEIKKRRLITTEYYTGIKYEQRVDY